MIFEQQGVYERAILDEFNPFFIPLDTDLLSLELPDFFCSTFLDGTNMWYKIMAHSLSQLQTVFDANFSIYGVGKAAEKISKLFLELTAEHKNESRTSFSSSSSPFAHVFLFDRDMDYVSVFLSCLTYEALIDDVFSINCGYTELPVESSQKQDSSSSEQQAVKVLLSNESDAIYASIRYEHFSRVLEELKWRVRDVQKASDKRHTIEKINEFKVFVANDLKNVKQNLRLLSIHISSCESINTKKAKEHFELQLRREHEILASMDYKDSISFIEDCACQQSNETTTLSLLCLLSLCQNGLSSKDYQNLRRQYLHAYGHKYLTAFFNLKKLGILYEKSVGVPSMMQNVVSSIGSPNISTKPSTGINFQNLCKKFNLTPDPTTDWKNQGHPSYVFNGAYTPVLCEIVDRSLSTGFQKDDLSKTFGRPVFSHEYDPLSGTYASPMSGKNLNKFTLSTSQTAAGVKPVILVCFLGGVTYAEMAALNWIGKRRDCRIVVATSHVPRLYAKSSKLKKALLERSTVLKNRYCPPFLCLNGTIHSLVRHFLRSYPVLPFERQILKMPDGGQVALDWLHPADGKDVPDAHIIIMLPGLTGSVFSNYILHMAKTSCENGYRTLVFNNRGNGGIHLLTPTTYTAANTEDTKIVVDYVRTSYPRSKLMAVGFSLGGMILFNYICTYDSIECGLDAAMVVCSPWDAMRASNRLEEPVYRFLFNYPLAKELCDNIRRNRALFEHLIDVDHVLRSQLIREFDQRFVVPMFKYQDVYEYYRDATFYHKVKRASVPVLCLNSVDDCFAPVESIPFEEVQLSENVMAVVTSHGGHLGYIKDWAFKERSVMEDLFSEFAQVIFDRP